MKIVKDILNISDLEERIKLLESRVSSHEDTIHAMTNCLRTQGEALKLLLYQMDIIKLNLNKRMNVTKKEEDIYN